MEPKGRTIRLTATRRDVPGADGVDHAVRDPDGGMHAKDLLGGLVFSLDPSH
jgi:hypothetical protein